MAKQESPKSIAQGFLWRSGIRQDFPACSADEGVSGTGGINSVHPNDFNDHLLLHEEETKCEPANLVKVKIVAHLDEPDDMEFHNVTKTYKLLPLELGQDFVITQ